MEPASRPHTAGPKFKINTRGADVIQSVYSFAMALGLTDVFVGSKTFLSDIIFGAEPLTDGRGLLTGLLLVNVVLLGLRFFWVPRNLSALVFKAAECSNSADQGDHRTLDILDINIALHMVMIFVHGAAFFLLCGEFEYILFLSSSSLPLNPALFTGYVIMHVCLLLINATWIGLLKIQEDQIERRAGKEGSEPSSAGDTWWQNNLICSLVAIAPFAVFGSCGSDLARCASHYSGAAHSVLDLAPLSAWELSVIFQHFASLLRGLGLSTPAPALTWALLVMVINSLWDLGTTGRSYLFFEDVEWEHRPRDFGGASTTPAAPRDEAA
jgi:hypothetical protein